MKKIKISVIMSVYNTKEQLLREAIESILNQTFEQFEFIIVNDCSDSMTSEVLSCYTDKRIKIINNIQNIGLTKSLNKALQVANGKYIARMDADDVSYAKRFERQYMYMEKNPSIDILGCWSYDGKNTYKYDGRLPTKCRKVKMLFGNSGIGHPTALIRHSFLKEKKIKYDERYMKSQDYKLWADCIEKGAVISVFPDTLLYYRRHEQQISNDSNGGQRFCANLIQCNLIKQLYSDISEKELQQLQNLNEKILDVDSMDNLCKKLEDANKTHCIYDSKILHYELIGQKNRVNGTFCMDIGYWIYFIRRFLWKRL